MRRTSSGSEARARARRRSAGASGKSFVAEWQREDVLAVQAAHLVVLEARGERRIARSRVDPAEEGAQHGRRRRRVGAARERVRERLGVAQILEHERHALRVEVVYARTHAIPIEGRHARVPARLALDPLGRDAVLGEFLERRARLLDDERALARVRAHAPDPVDVSVAGALDLRGFAGGKQPQPDQVAGQLVLAERELLAHAAAVPAQKPLKPRQARSMRTPDLG